MPPFVDQSAMLESLIKHSSDVIMVADREHRVIFVNRLEAGRVESEVVGATTESLVPPSVREDVYRLVEDVFTRGRSNAFEARHEGPTGERWNLTRLAPLWDGDEVRACSLISTDITERKQAELIAQHEQAFSHAMAVASSSVVGPVDEESVLEDFLTAMLRVLRCDRAWLIAPCDPTAKEFEVVHEQTVPDWPGVGAHGSVPMEPGFAADMANALASAGALRRDPECDPIREDEPLFQKFGVRSMLMMAIHPKDSEPWLFGIHHCGSAQVYVDQVQWFESLGARLSEGLSVAIAQRKLRQSEERFRTLFEQAAEAIVILDGETGRFCDVNANAKRLFGATREQLLARGPMELSPEKQPDGEPSGPKAQRLIERAFQGEVPTFEWTHQTLAGEEVPCEVRLVRLPHPTRRLLRGSLTDISERKRAEGERARLREELFQAQKMQALGQLTGGVAHDFNNLLTVISGSLTLIELNRTDSQAAEHHIRQAQEATERAGELTHRLLAFARRQPLRPQAVDLNQLVAGAEKLLTRALGEAVVVDIRTGEVPWPCRVDPRQLENALLNLAINARDAMPEGGRLTIETDTARFEPTPGDADVPEPGEYVILRVTDEGHGIPKDVQAQVFEPFFTTKEAGKGSGLGLSMVYGFVKQSGGHLSLRSTPGEGTCIELYLPRSVRERANVESKVARQADPLGAGRRVLVVEDEPSVRKLIHDLVKALGYKPLCVASGDEAVAMLRECPDVAVLLTDVVLAGGEQGTDVAARVRELQRELPVVYMSGYTRDAVPSSTPLKGDRLLEKPFRKDELALALHGALSDPARGAAGRTR